MKKLLAIVFGLMSIVFLCGSSGAALIDLGNGVIFDNTAKQYWIQDLTLFTNQTHTQQLNTIAGLNLNPAFQNSAWGSWHLADYAKTHGLYLNLTSIDDFFIRSDTGSDSWPSYYTWWWGRYDETILISGITYDKVMHVTYRTWPITNPPGNWFPDQFWGGMENYILPTATYINAGTGLDVDIGAWVTADWISDFQPPQNPIPEPATMLLIGSGLIGLAGLRKKFKK